jgi:hypothetical protein
VSGRVRLFLVCGVLIAVLMQSSVAGAASSWNVGLGSSGGETQATGAPSAPTGVTAVCTSPISNTGEVSWSAVTEATSYTIYYSTTSSTDGFSPAATGVVGTTWTSPGLGSGDYWFEVAAYVGTYWASPNSVATSQLTIAALTCT